MSSPAFHVNGTAYLQVDLGDGVVDLGYSKSGVTITLNYETEDVFTDLWGPKVPQDVLNYGQTAEVKATLIYYDNEVLELLQNRLASGTAGTMPNVNGETLAIGALMGQCNWMNKLYVLRGNSCTDTGSTAEGGWCFGAAYLSGPDSFTVGTKVTEHEITFRCLPDASGVLFSKYLPS